ncbi:MAG: type II toxin-antitoxin system HipA family toxin [Sideroxydans sp.]|nr:type II toxin-antitoxin system HipA family toxin [Sideroxydans sp.]
MKKLSVLYEGWGGRWLLGTLADNGSDVLFEYSQQALAQGLELSPRHLKLQAGAYGDFPSHLERLPGLIADALPDGWGLMLMNKQFRRAGRSPASISVLDRLAFIGERAMGALAFEPADDGEIPPKDLSLLTLAKEIKQVVAGEESDALEQLALMGGSPHGARPKVLVNYEMESGTLSSDSKAAGEPWLIKFPAQHEHKEVCAIEALYAKLASDCDIEMPQTRYFDINASLSAYGIARFDRHAGLRIPTHTLAGLLHSDFRIPSVDCTTFLRATRFLTRDEREVKKAFLRCVFNVVMHNRDDHAKNISYCLTQDRQWKLSPGYDLTFSSGPGGEHQMDVCGEGNNPGKTHLLRLAKEAEVNAEVAKHAIEAVCAVAERFTEEAKAFPIRKASVQNIDALIKLNLARLGEAG